MVISREKTFETCAGTMLVLVSLYTALRVAKEYNLHSHTTTLVFPLLRRSLGSGRVLLVDRLISIRRHVQAVGDHEAEAESLEVTACVEQPVTCQIFKHTNNSESTKVEALY